MSLKKQLYHQCMDSIGEAYHGIPDQIEGWYKPGDKPANRDCPLCGSDVRLDSLGHMMLWRCVADPTHTGSWIDEESKAICADRRAIGKQGARVRPTSRRATISKQALEVISDGKVWYCAWIAEAIGAEQRFVSDALCHMRKRGLVERLGGGNISKWRKL